MDANFISPLRAIFLKIKYNYKTIWTIFLRLHFSQKILLSIYHLVVENDNNYFNLQQLIQFLFFNITLTFKGCPEKLVNFNLAALCTKPSMFAQVPLTSFKLQLYWYKAIYKLPYSLSQWYDNPDSAISNNKNPFLMSSHWIPTTPQPNWLNAIIPPE